MMSEFLTKKANKFPQYNKKKKKKKVEGTRRALLPDSSVDHPDFYRRAKTEIISSITIYSL